MIKLKTRQGKETHNEENEITQKNKSKLVTRTTLKTVGRPCEIEKIHMKTKYKK